MGTDATRERSASGEFAREVARPAVPDAADAGPQGEERRLLALAMVVVGSLLLARQAGVWFDDAVVWPVVLAAAGVAVLWRQAESLRRGRTSTARVLLGAAFVAAGVAVFLAAHDALAAARDGVLAILAVVAGLTLLFGPWVWRLASEAAEQRRARVRSEERAELAAQLHDSVLQTLSLVQRHASDPRAVTRLARRQERELRSWLYGDGSRRDGTFEAAMAGVAAEVEDLHEVALELVVVGGDVPLAEPETALVAAAREAMVNAARHSGAAAVSVYAEVEADAASVFVRDRGKGFDPGAVPGDRHGISDSIVRRVERHGGTATLRSTAAEGTEVRMSVPRRRS